jgi:hypothetical protein
MNALDEAFAEDAKIRAKNRAVKLTAARDAAFQAFQSAKKGKCKKALAQAESDLKAAAKALTAAKAAEVPAVEAIDQNAIISRLNFRQWLASAKLQVWYCAHEQYPVMYADAYFASYADARKSRGSDYVVRSARVPAGSEVALGIFGEKGLFELFEKSIRADSDESAMKNTRRADLVRMGIIEE